ncbi:MAG: hypothetical protein L3K02_07580, partial [Thermoplasmata archaeon]|nr:hypothetical protein [Thermoplasmata archaeon]
MRNRNRFRQDRRGLAEIVGTLMLVLIVVAAATAFSFFVASEEQTNLQEQNQLHLKNLENVTVQSVDNTPGYFFPPLSLIFYSGNITLVLSSADIYNMSLTDIAIGGDPAQSYCEDPGCNVSVLADKANFHQFPVAGGSSYLTLPAFSVTAVTINDSAFYLQPFVYSSKSIQIQLGTTLGNTFVETLFPPVPEIGLNFLTGYPILDGSQSYQPHSGSSPNAAIVQWVWTVTTMLADPDSGTYYGQEAQLPHPFVTT